MRTSKRCDVGGCVIGRRDVDADPFSSVRADGPGTLPSARVGEKPDSAIKRFWLDVNSAQREAFDAFFDFESLLVFVV